MAFSTRWFDKTKQETNRSKFLSLLVGYFVEKVYIVVYASISALYGVFLRSRDKSVLVYFGRPDILREGTLDREMEGEKK